jgi:hypothetical protein
MFIIVILFTLFTSTLTQSLNTSVLIVTKNNQDVNIVVCSNLTDYDVYLTGRNTSCKNVTIDSKFYINFTSMIIVQKIGELPIICDNYEDYLLFITKSYNTTCKIYKQVHPKYEVSQTTAVTIIVSYTIFIVSLSCCCLCFFCIKGNRKSKLETLYLREVEEVNREREEYKQREELELVVTPGNPESTKSRTICSLKSLSSEETECIICLETYNDLNSITRMHCNHVFHTSCIDKWISKSPEHKCPMCRRSIDPTV